MAEPRVALVTGSTRGIGWAVAQRLAAEGATVVVNGRSDGKVVESRAQELRQRFGVEAQGVAFDVADPAAVREAYQAVFARHRRLDVLVASAGILEESLLGMTAPDSIERVLRVNVAGALHNVQAASRLMSRHRRGSIVTLASVVGLRGAAGQAAYAASKAAVVGLTLSAAKELAPMGIRVNAVAPGIIGTDMTRQRGEERVAESVARVGLGRPGTAEEVAEVIAFLASDRASYVTGQVVGVDGGLVL